MGTPLPNVADLEAIADTLDETEPGSKFSNAVRNARRAQSCIADVSSAIINLEALAQLRDRPRLPVAHQTATEAALITSSIILYSRATTTGAKKGERGHISIRERLCPEDQADHDRLIAIRNLALTHVTFNEIVAEQLWHKEVIFAVEQAEGAWLPAAMTKRIQVSEPLVVAMRRLFPAALGVLRSTYHKRLNHVTAVLQKRPDSAKLLFGHRLDPVELFGSKAEARKALRRKPGQRTSGVTRE